MRKNIFIILILSISFIGFSQELMFEIRPKYEKAIKKEAIAEAQKLSDFIASYPSNWVKDYVSVEISANENGNIQKAIGENETLNNEQKSILQNVNLFTDLEISVWYKTPNSVTEQLEKRNMVVKMTVIPDAEAEYIEGTKELKRFLKEQIIDKISVIPK